MVFSEVCNEADELCPLKPDKVVTYLDPGDRLLPPR